MNHLLWWEMLVVGGRGDCALAGHVVCGKSLFMALNVVVSIKSCKKIAFKIFKC